MMSSFTLPVIMNMWHANQRVTAFIESKSVVTVKRNFKRKFNISVGSSISSRNLILDWHYRFKNNGHVVIN